MHDATIKAIKEHRVRLIHARKRLERESADNEKQAASIATSMAKVKEELAGVDQDLVAAGVDPESSLADSFIDA